MSGGRAGPGELGVWLITDVYPPDCGGSGWSTHALALGLLEAGHRVEVVTVDPARASRSQRIFEGVPVTEVGVAPARLDPRRRLGRRDYAHRLLVERLTSGLRRDPGIDVVHGQHLHTAPPAAEAARAAGRAAVSTVRDYWPVCLHGTAFWGGRVCPGCTTPNLTGCMNDVWGWPRPLSRAMVGWARRRLAARADGLAAAHRVVFVSEAVRNRVQPVVEEESGRRVEGRVIPNTVDPDLVTRAAAGAGDDDGATPRPPYLLAAGKLAPTKGFRRLIEALATVREGAGGEARLPELAIAGTGPAEAELRRRATELGVAVRFLGWQEHDRLLHLASRARALVVPSAWDEPLSRLILEGMALGVPVVAWATGGSPEAIEHGVDGWLVETPGDLEAALVELEDGGIRRRIGEAALRTARNRFAPAVVVPRIEAVYAEALAVAGRPGDTAATAGGESARGAGRRMDGRGDL